MAITQAHILATEQALQAERAAASLAQSSLAAELKDAQQRMEQALLDLEHEQAASWALRAQLNEMKGKCEAAGGWLAG